MDKLEQQKRNLEYVQKKACQGGESFFWQRRELFCFFVLFCFCFLFVFGRTRLQVGATEAADVPSTSWHLPPSSCPSGQNRDLQEETVNRMGGLLGKSHGKRQKDPEGAPDLPTEEEIDGSSIQRGIHRTSHTSNTSVKSALFW